MDRVPFFLLLMFFTGACSLPGKVSVSENPAAEGSKKTNQIYRGSNLLTNDLIHTRLDLKFDWDKKQVTGNALLTLQPYFYPASVLYLHARGMELHEVSLKTGETKIPLSYIYKNDSLTINLDHTYTKEEKYTIFISYTASPDDLEKGGSVAITSDKGLYFINADGKEINKPKQIWSQGETQSNSSWFPTIESPNERMTQEIYLTVDSSYQTLSNGLLLSSTMNPDGSRTDYWKQSLPAAPYLTMIAIGKYAIVKDTWRNLEVSYYVEPEYEKYARMIFGHTPEMMEFFSGRLGVDFAWEKYAQVVVRDYVSGAMENTTAVVHGEYMQQDAREYLDNAYEDIIAHELFHHWFGDLVTCESWSDVPLNESFATYGQYLWNEYKYGRDEADYGLQQDLSEYLLLSKSTSPPLIRHDYNNREDLFDAVSYQKGGCILHMLRKMTGDDAFFAALKKYLTDNRFKSVEPANLRLAFEEVTGRDLNWFFNDWFFNGGQPQLQISYAYNDSMHSQQVFIAQKQDTENMPLYQLPVKVDLYYNDTVIRKEVLLQHAADTFNFSSPERPLFVNFDAEKMLVGSKTDMHSVPEWVYMFSHAPLYLDRYEALNKIIKNYKGNDGAADALKKALDDHSGIYVLWQPGMQIILFLLKNTGRLLKTN